MSNLKAKPFIQWLGGEKTLLTEIKKLYPIDKGVTKYCEPFVGAGEVLFDALSNHTFKHVLITDLNRDLIDTYIMVRDKINELTTFLVYIGNEYNYLKDEFKEQYYLKKRERFNELKRRKLDYETLEKSALFIFLNKAGFCGVNRDLNTSLGYKYNPFICNNDILFKDSELLQNVEINCADFSESISFITRDTFVYIDPPYLDKSGENCSVNYTEYQFDHRDQLRLFDYIHTLDVIGAKVLLSKPFYSFTTDYNNNYDSLIVDAKRSMDIARTAKEVLVTNY